MWISLFFLLEPLRSVPWDVLNKVKRISRERCASSLGTSYNSII
jgi:hypothetical protein